ncbi:hypothetical protein [Nitrososphaeria virus YSH_174770]|uniref:Uncharacterized protein n=1 Tax=Nitrososphaeria virus YSH_174770 TaxID=3071322 RepID=A0A976YEZ9_9CAUD|nr:hypothetical protein QKV93_gp35 [Yangshan Harbor Nitrososphaeria virus]UVF62380.1 hypothetical protein [Nitrososphaeria virus YSH_174770]
MTDTLIKSAIKANSELSDVISSLMNMRQEKHRPNMQTLNNFVNKLAIANNEISIILKEANKIQENHFSNKSMIRKDLLLD